MAAPKIDQYQLRDDLQEVLTRHGFEVLMDDGLTAFRDAYSDAYMVYFRPAGWKDRWKYQGPVQKEKAEPIPEPGHRLGCGCLDCAIHSGAQ